MLLYQEHETEQEEATITSKQREQLFRPLRYRQQKNIGQKISKQIAKENSRRCIARSQSVHGTMRATGRERSE